MPSSLKLMTIFGNASDSGLHPVTPLNQGFSCYITWGVGSLAGQSRSSLAAGIAARLLLKISLCVRSRSTSKTYKFAKSALLQLSPQRTTSLNILYSSIIALQ